MRKTKQEKAIEEANRIAALKRLIGQVNKPAEVAGSKTGGVASVFWQVRTLMPRAVSEGGPFHQLEVAYQVLRTIAEMDKSELMPEIVPAVIPAELRLGADGRIHIESPILNALQNVEVNRLHVCPGCDCIYYDRPNKKTCSVACGSRKRQRDFRKNPDSADKIAGYRNRADEKRVGKETPIHTQSPIFQAKNRSKAR